MPIFNNCYSSNGIALQRKLYPIVGSTSEKAREAADELAASGDYDLIFCGFARTVESTRGVPHHRQYGLCPDSHHSRSYHHAEHARFFPRPVLDYVKNTKDVPLKDISLLLEQVEKNVPTWKFTNPMQRS